MMPSGSLYTARLSVSSGGTVTETDEGSAVVVVVAIACVVGHVTTATSATTNCAEASLFAAVAAVAAVDDAVVVVVVDPGAEVDVVGGDVPVVELGPEEPHPLRARAAAATAAALTTRTLIDLRPFPRDPAAHPSADYASTVSDSNSPAKRRCASARRVGMCSLGTSRGE